MFAGASGWGIFGQEAAAHTRNAAAPTTFENEDPPGPK